jgi:protein-S-isoprenylcysteine O-methyltransferase Ste14
MLIWSIYQSLEKSEFLDIENAYMQKQSRTGMVIPWVNLISLHISAFLFGYLGILSTMPVTLEEQRGEEAWDYCRRIRYWSFVFAMIMILNVILWVWFPIPELGWQLNPDPMVGILIGLIIAAPCLVILAIAMRDAGVEMHYPIKETTLHGGIYKKIRHPGILGEMPLYVVLAMFVNSLFLVLWMIVFIIIFTTINIYYEEKDLVKRFGRDYEEYRERTPALLPGFRRRGIRREDDI